MTSKIDFKNKKLWLISILILLVIFSTNPEIKEKKAGVGNILLGTITIIGSIFAIPTFPLIGIPLFIAGLGLMGAGVTQSWIDIFRPVAIIPMWVYIAGFAILFFMMMRKK